MKYYRMNKDAVAGGFRRGAVVVVHYESETELVVSSFPNGNEHIHINKSDAYSVEHDVGKTFIVDVETCGFKSKQLVTLYKVVQGGGIFKGDNDRYNNADGEPGAFLGWHEARLLDNKYAVEKSPAAKAGMSVGDYVRLNKDIYGMRSGDILQLQRDDFSNQPLFKYVDGNGVCWYNNAADDEPGAFLKLDYVTTDMEIKDAKPGDKFRMITDAVGFEKDQIVTLARAKTQDRSNPLFSGTNSLYWSDNGRPGAYMDWSRVVPVREETPTAVVRVDDMKVDLTDNKLHGTDMPLARVIMSEFSSWPGEWRRDWVFQDYDKEIRGVGGTSHVFADKLSDNHRELGDDNPLKDEAPYMKTFTREQFDKLNQLIGYGYTLWFGGSNRPRHIQDGSSIEIVWSDGDVQTEDEVPSNRRWQWDLDDVNIIAYKIIEEHDSEEPEVEGYIITKEQYQKLDGLINNLSGGEFSAAFDLGRLMAVIEKQVK